MQDSLEWWQCMFKMHSMLLKEQDDALLREFKKQLDTIRFEYGKPYEGLGVGGAYVKDIAGWFDDVSRWSEAQGDYLDAEKYLRIAMDFYQEPQLNFNSDCYLEALYRMYDIVDHCPRSSKGPWC